MRFLKVFLFTVALCTIGLSAGADQTGADCWQPVSSRPLDFEVLGPRLFLTDVRVTPEGSLTPYSVPLWVAPAPQIGEQDDGQTYQVYKMGHKKGLEDGLGEPSGYSLSPYYVLEIGKKNGQPASVVASGTRTGDLSGEGKVAIRKVVDIFGKAESSSNYIATTTGADYQVVRIPLGKSGVTLVAVGRTAFQVQSTGGAVNGHLQPGGGFALEVPTGEKGEILRIGVTAGPSIGFGGTDKSISPTISSGAQLLVF
ncbi:MAG: hypothetical protein HY074_09775 [Deltaproteobacteria bacterium]|nr:hypothetical protein [Deltaproteobacteria bacterium]